MVLALEVIGLFRREDLASLCERGRRRGGESWCQSGEVGYTWENDCMHWREGGLGGFSVWRDET